MNNIKYFYIRQPNLHNPNHRGAPIACIAYTRQTDPDTEGELVLYALSAVHPNDEFRKDRAREIASGRLESKRVRGNGLNVGKDYTGNMVIGSILTDVLCDLNVTSPRVLQYAAAWLDKKPHCPECNDFNYFPPSAEVLSIDSIKERDPVMISTNGIEYA